jgi:hypothetical protein
MSLYFDKTRATRYVNKLMEQKLKVEAKVLSSIMQSEVPVRTGLLRASITIARTGELEYKVGHRPGILRAASGDDYGTSVYFGYRFRRPNDWVGRTLSRFKSRL